MKAVKEESCFSINYFPISEHLMLFHSYYICNAVFFPSWSVCLLAQLGFDTARKSLSYPSVSGGDAFQSVSEQGPRAGRPLAIGGLPPVFVFSFSKSTSPDVLVPPSSHLEHWTCESHTASSLIPTLSFLPSWDVWEPADTFTMKLSFPNNPKHP